MTSRAKTLSRGKKVIKTCTRTKKIQGKTRTKVHGTSHGKARGSHKKTAHAHAR